MDTYNQPEVIPISPDPFSSNFKSPLSNMSESNEAEQEENMLLLPIQRSDILGKDEDLEAIEEFYLREIEETVHADMIQKVKKKEQEIRE